VSISSGLLAAENKARPNQIEIYKSSDGETQIEVKFEQGTVWLSQKQMSDLFDKDTDNRIALKKYLQRKRA
jgi:hypothetical protein